MLGQFELEILRALETIRFGPLNFIFKYLTMLGEATAIVTVIILFYYVIDKEFGRELVYLYSGSQVTNGIAKNFAKVPRPFAVENPVSCVYPDTATGYSFPSGHTQGTAVIYPSIARWWKKNWFSIIVAIIIVVVAFSRMYLGCHYLSDVVVGAGLGLFFALVMSGVYEKFGWKKTYLISILVTLPFAVYFLFGNDILFKDFYSSYGILTLGYFGLLLEDKYVQFKIEGSLLRRFIRFAIAGVVAVACLVGLKPLFKIVTDALGGEAWIECISAFLRYGILSFFGLGVVPLLLKKLKI